MDRSGYFPGTVTVTEQTFSTGDFSAEWRTGVANLATRIFDEYRKSGKKRFIAVIGGASGSGKSTAAVIIEDILNKLQKEVRVLAVGQDGYHFKQDYLLKTLDKEGAPLAEHKGRYDSFDTVSMKSDLESFIEGKETAFPLYSRKIHNPIPNAIPCTEESCLLIFEGLWLLYDEKPWNELLSLYDFTVFINASPDIRKENTVKRHIRGNERLPGEAEAFYEKSDAKNAELIVAHISRHNLDFYYNL